MASVSSGTLIAERYRLERPLGTGGSATVWKAVDLVLERAVAVKLLRDATSGDNADRERLRREARTLARLAHPRIVTIWDFFETELPGAPAQPVLVTELVNGTSLDARLEQGPLPWEDAVRVCGQLADALRAAHAVGIVHRDIKPANVILVGDGIKLLDFGIARSPNDTRLTGNLTIGTPLCMAPEQIRGRGAVPESDIYALGCVLFWCLTGHPPYDGGDVADILEAHLCDQPPPLAIPGLPRAIAEFCHACLEKNPSFRPDAVRAVGALFPGEPQTAIIGAVKEGERRGRRRTVGFATVTLGHLKAGLTTGRFGVGRNEAASTGAQRRGPVAPGTSSVDAARPRAQEQGSERGPEQALTDADVIPVPHRFKRNRPTLVPVLAVSLPFAAASITAVILLVGAPGAGTGAPLGAPVLPGPSYQTSQPGAVRAAPSASVVSRRASAPAISHPASSSAVSPSAPATSPSPSTVAPVGDPIQYLDSVRQQIAGLVAQGPATMDATTGGNLRNSIADIQNSILTAQQNGGAAHLQEVRDKIAAFNASLPGLVSQSRVSSAAANQLTGEMNRLSAALTD